MEHELPSNAANDEHQFRIYVVGVLSELRTRVAAFTTFQQDVESRVRQLERNQWRLFGGGSLFAFIISKGLTLWNIFHH